MLSPFSTCDRNAVVLREHYNAGLDHGLLTARLDETRSLAWGEVAEWAPTGLAPSGSLRFEHELAATVCQFLLRDPYRYSYFFVAFAAERDAVAARILAATDSLRTLSASLPQDGTCPDDAIERLPSVAFTLIDVGEPICR